MSATPTAPNLAEDDDLAEEAFARVISSPQFVRAETQRKLLIYLWQTRHDTVSEYGIATEALGRSSNFDPNTDASIRVHISRLRRKLKDYYAETGEPESLVIPTGTHQLVVRVVEPLSAAPAEIASPVATTSETAQKPPGWMRLHAVPLLSGMCLFLLLLFSAAAVLALRQARQLKSPTSAGLEEANIFWKNFLEGDAPVRIVLPTPVFFNFRDHPLLKMRSTHVNSYDEIAQDPQFKALAEKLGPMGLEQSYTVTWDTLAGIQIARYLDRVGQARRVSFEVTRDSSLLSLEQANVIVLGTDNTLRPMREYTESMNFIMTPGEERVLNSRPQKGEEASYVRVVREVANAKASSVRHVDPSIIALLPGRAPGLRVLMLESRDTSDIVSLLTSKAGSNAVDEMWRSHGSPRYFEMVTMTEMEGNTALRSWPVTIHPYTQDPPSKGL